MPFGASNQHQGRIVKQRLRKSTFHIPARQADILEHPIIELGKLNNFTPVLQGFEQVTDSASQSFDKGRFRNGHN
jgi:hypothetical protein